MSILSMALLVVAIYLIYKAAYRKYWNKGLNYRLEFSSSQAFEGDKLILTKELTNAKPLPMPWVTAKIRMSRGLVFGDEDGGKVSDDYYQNDLFSMGLYQRVTRRQEFICGRRGYYHIKDVDLSANDFLTDSRMVKHLQSGASLTVYPRLIDPPGLADIFRQIYGEIEVRRFTNPDPFAFRGIREYQSGDDFRSVNWKATAVTGSPMVNVNAATASRELVILLGLEPYSTWTDDEVLEEGIRIAAAAARYFTSQGLPAGVLTNGRDLASKAPLSIRPGSGNEHFYSILDMLSRIDIPAGQPPMSGIVSTLRDTGPYYLLISTYDGEDLANAFTEMLESGADARWIIPAKADDKLRIDEDENPLVTRWEVDTYNAGASYYKRHSV